MGKTRRIRSGATLIAGANRFAAIPTRTTFAVVRRFMFYPLNIVGRYCSSILKMQIDTNLGPFASSGIIIMIYNDYIPFIVHHSGLHYVLH